MTTTRDLDAIQGRLIRLADPDWQTFHDAKALLELARAQQQRIAELEAERDERMSRLRGDLEKIEQRERGKQP